MVANVLEPDFSALSLKREQEYREANELNYGFDNTVLPSFSPKGHFRPQGKTTWLGGQVENRLRLNALASMEDGPTAVDVLLNDLFTIGFSFENSEDINSMILLNNVGGGQVQSNVDGSLIPFEELQSKNIFEYMSPTVLNTLEQYQVDVETIKDLSVEDALVRLKREILAISLTEELQNSSDTIAETWGGNALAFAAGFVDITTVATLGTAGLAKGAGAAVVRSAAVNAESSILKKAAANTVRRFGRNQTITGSLIDNSFTRNHAATMLGIDAALTGTAIDLALQKKEYDILDKYYSEYDAPWFNFGRSAVAGTLGFALGGTVGKLFGVSKAPRERAKVIDNIMQKIGVDLTPEQQVAVRQIVDDTYSGYQPLPSLTHMYDTVGKEKGHEVLRVVLNDMIDARLARFENGKLIDGKITQAQYLKEQINEAVSNAELGFEVTQAQLDDFNARWLDNENRIEALTNELNTDPYLTPDGKRLKRLPDGVAESRRAARKELKERLERRRLLNREQERIAIQTKINNDINQRFGAISGRNTGDGAPADLTNIGGPATQVVIDVPTGKQTAINTAYQIADMLNRSPTFEEVDSFIKALNIDPSQRALKLQRQVNKIIEVQNQAFIAKNLSPDVDTASIDRLAANAIADIEETHIGRVFARKRPNEWQTSFEKAVALRALAADKWRYLEDSTLTPLERNAIIQEALNDLDNANALINEVLNSVVGVMDAETRKGSNERAKYAVWLEGHQLVPVTKRSAESARALLEAHFIDYGSAPPLYTDNYITKFLFNDIANKFSGAGTPRHVMIEVAKGSPEIAMAINMIGDLTNVTRAYGGRSRFVPSLEIMHRRYLRRLDRDVFQAQKKLTQKYPDGKEFQAQIYQAMQYAAGVKNILPEDPDTAALAKGLRKFYGDLEVRANREGVLRTGVDHGYINVSLKPSLGESTAEAAQIRDVIVDELTRHWVNAYRPGTGQPFRLSVLAFADVLAPIAGVNKNGEKVWAFKNVRLKEGSKLDFDPTKNYSEFEISSLLTEEDLFQLERLNADGTWTNLLEVYEKNFNDGIRKEAEGAVSNRVRLTGSAEQSDGALTKQTSQRAVNSLELRRENANERRKIPLAVLLSDRVLATGAVLTDPVSDAHHYWFSFASDLALQEMMTRATGKHGITWESFVSFGIDRHREANKNPDGTYKYTDKFYGDFEAFLYAAKDSVSGRNYVRNESDGFTTGLLQFINHLLSSGVNAGVGVVMPATEIVVPALTHMLVTKNKKQKIVEMLKAVKYLNKDQRAALGNALLQAQAASRHLTDTHEINNELYTSYWKRLAAPWIRVKDAAKGVGTAKSFQASTTNKAGRFANSAVAFAEALSDTTRAISGELLWTYMAQNIFGTYHTNLVSSQMDRIAAAQNLIGPMKGPIPPKQLAGIARKVGLDYADLLAYMDAGLIIQGPNRGLELLRMLKNAGATDFGDVDNTYRVIETFDSALYREELREMYDRVLDHATKQVDRDVTKANVWDRPAHANNALVSIIHRYLSFARGFRNGRLADMANAGVMPFSQVYTGYMMAELFNRNLMSVIFHGESIDDLAEKWEEDPEKMTVYSLAGVPILGGSQSFLTSVVANVFDADAQFNSSFVPSGSMIRRKLTSINNILRDARDPDESISDDDLLELGKSLPGVNQAASMVLLHHVMTSDDDE